MSLRSLLGPSLAARRPRNDAPVPYTGRYSGSLLGFGASRRKHDQHEELEAYGENGTLFGVVSRLAMNVSLVDWRLYRKLPDGTCQEITTPTAQSKIWTRPNNYMTRQELVESVQQHIDLTGLGFIVIARAGSMPIEMWPVRPDRMTVIPSRQDFIAGYVYTSPDGEQVPLLKEDVLMLRWPAPLDIYGGQAPLSAVSRDLEAEEEAQRYSAAFFRNSATPGGIIKTGVKLSEPEFDELVDRWNRSHRGTSNAGRVAVLEQGDFVPLAYTQRDMQFVESRGLTKQAILDAYGFPKFGLGDVADVNRAVAEASRALMAESLDVPRLERWKAALNWEFLPMFGPGWEQYEFDYVSPVTEDQELENATLTATVQAAVSMITAGADPVETCAAFGLPDVTWLRGDRPKVTDNVSPA